MIVALFKVVLDANVLFPFSLRDTLLRAAAEGRRASRRHQQPEGLPRSTGGHGAIGIDLEELLVGS